MPAIALKRDAIESSVINALEKAGCSVWRLNGKGVPDLLVGRAGSNFLLEVKDPQTGRLTQDQIYWHKTWRGRAHIVHSIDEALKAVGLI